MPIPRLLPQRTALLVIDMQESLLSTIPNADRIANNCDVLLRAADALGLPYLVTEHYPRGLGRTVEQVASAMSDQSRRVEKTAFSAAVGLPAEQLQTWGSASVLIAGMETHIAVVQTVLDLQAAGRQCFVCADAVGGSRADQSDHALGRMRDAGAVITGVVSAMYELLGTANDPRFRLCLELAKRVQ